MQITNLRPVGAGSTLARFDIEVTPEIKLLDWTLKTGGRVFPPSPRYGNPAARVSPKIMAQITELAVEACKGGVARHDYPIN